MAISSIHDLRWYHFMTPAELRLNEDSLLGLKVYEKDDVPCAIQDGFDQDIVNVIRDILSGDKLEALKFLTPQEHRFRGSTMSEYEDKPYTPIYIQERWPTKVVGYIRSRAGAFKSVGDKWVDENGETSDKDCVLTTLEPLDATGATVRDPRPLDERLRVEHRKDLWLRIEN